MSARMRHGGLRHNQHVLGEPHPDGDGARGTAADAHGAHGIRPALDL